MGYLSRQPNSNDPPKFQNNPWGAQDSIRDDIAVILGEDGKRCTTCKRVILNEHLKQKDDKNYCPDCY